LRLQIYDSSSSLIFVRIAPPERQEFAHLLTTMGDSELTVDSDKGVVRFVQSSGDSVEARDLSDIRIVLTDDIIRYLVDSIEQHAREQEYHPFNCGLSELGAAIRPRSKNVVIQATSFFDVNTQEEMDEFLESIGRFHDAVVREIAVVSHAYVDADGWMHDDFGPADARFVVHTQFPKPACIEIVMEEIQTLRLDAGELPEVGLIGIIADNGSVISGNPANRGAEMLLAKKMRYRILGRESLGKQLRAVSTHIVGQSGTLQTDTDTGVIVSAPRYP
jgi:hypothetical protein